MGYLCGHIRMNLIKLEICTWLKMAVFSSHVCGCFAGVHICSAFITGAQGQKRALDLLDLKVEWL